MVQDGGRISAEPFGASRGGVLDFALYWRALRLVECTHPLSAVLEVVSGPVILVPSDDVLIAVTGAKSVRCRSQIIPSDTGFWAPANHPITVDGPQSARAYVAVHGGFDIGLILGGRGTDIRNHFGGFNGRPLQKGDVLGVLPSTLSRLPHTRWRRWNPEPRNPLRTLRFVWDHAVERYFKTSSGDFTGADYTVEPASNGMAIRLHGAPLGLSNAARYLSEPVLPGTIQIALDGEPLLLLAHRGTMGGYPPIGHVITPDLWHAAQLKPGDVISFKPIALAQARQISQQSYLALSTAVTYTEPVRYASEPSNN